MQNITITCDNTGFNDLKWFLFAYSKQYHVKISGHHIYATDGFRCHRIVHSCIIGEPGVYQLKTNNKHTIDLVPMRDDYYPRVETLFEKFDGLECNDNTYNESVSRNIHKFIRSTDKIFDIKFLTDVFSAGEAWKTVDTPSLDSVLFSSEGQYLSAVIMPFKK